MNMSEENSSSSAMNEHIEEGDERDELHEQDSRQQSCSKTNKPELDSQALLSVLATMQANMTQTNRFLARLFNENDSAASQLKRKRQLDSPLENNDILAGSSIVAYSGSKRIRLDSVQSVNFPEDPVSSDMSATASEKASNEASEKADSEKASEKACNVAPERAQPTAVSFSVRSAEDDALSLCGGNDFDRENESDDEDPDNEELLAQIDGAYGHLDETGPPISERLANVVAKKITTDYDLDQRKEILSKYKTPQNCDELYVPRINPEIWEKLKPFARKKDIKVSVLQDILVKVTSAISLVTDDLLQSRERKLKPNYQVLISRLIDSVALLGHANKELSFKRKEALRPHLSSDFKPACSRNFKPEKYLFGNDLAKTLQQIKATSQVVGNFVTPPYNYNRPQPRPRFNNLGQSQRPFLVQRGGTQYSPRPQLQQYQRPYHPKKRYTKH